MSVDEQGLTGNFVSFGETPEERAAWLQEELQVISGWYEQLGAPGEAFLTAMGETGFGVGIDLSESDTAAYYGHMPGKGFLNEIMLGSGALSSREQLFSFFSHEGFHAIQSNRAPALHATMAVSGLDIALCPRHSVWAQELAERDAYAKQIWFTILLAAADPDRAAGLERLRPPPSKYAAILERNPVMALAMFGEHSMHSSDPGGRNIKDWYNGYALAHFQALLEQRQAQRKGLPFFVRMEPGDALAIGSSMGINSFGPPGKLYTALGVPPDLSPAHDAATLALNDALGIRDEQQLPTLGEALALRGLTRAQFMAACRANNPPPPLILMGSNSAPRPPGP